MIVILYLLAIPSIASIICIGSSLCSSMAVASPYDYDYSRALNIQKLGMGQKFNGIKYPQN